MTADGSFREGLSVASLTIAIADEAALAVFAKRFVAVLPARAFVALSGGLGAGKTTFVKHVAAAEGIDPTEVVSPTFGLIHEYVLLESAPGVAGEPRPRIVHADMYRLTGVDDLAETGWQDAIAGRCHVFVEWPERIAAALPEDRLDLTIAIVSPEQRVLTLTGRGAAHARIVDDVRARSI
jgi:tRNA threonylcarbamoyl adenosine modification protein YjeE